MSIMNACHAQSWGELVYSRTLFLLHTAGQQKEEGGLRKDKLHLQESMFLLSVGEEGVCLISLAVSDSICAKFLGKALCCTRGQQGY